MKTIIFLLLISFNTHAQYLSQSKDYITSVLKEQKVKFIEVDEFISTPNISNCNCLFEFNKQGICIKEMITALSNPAIASLIMDLNEKYYVRLNDVYFHEESYGLVEVIRKNSTFVFSYE